MSNPYLPEWEYIPDGEPHVFNDRLYVFGSHDKFKGKKFCEEDYVGWSCPLDNLNDWRFDGVIYKKVQHPGNEDGRLAMYAPDVVKGNDGRYYLYYSLADYIEMGVAVCDTPTGQYEFLGLVKYKDGTPWGKKEGNILPFDPGVINDDGHIYLYSGQGPMNKIHGMFSKVRKTSFVVELEDDMLTMKYEPKEIVPSATNSKGTGFEGHEFFEASSIRKFNNKYYFIYSSVLSHELVYAISDKPDRNFKYGGILTSSPDVGLNGNKKKLYWYGNNHGSIECINGKYYVFGHRHTNISMFSRQGYADPIEMKTDGNFIQAPRTSSGFDAPTKEGFRACKVSHLISKIGATFSIEFVPFRSFYPYITQNEEEKGYQYITNLKNKSLAGFRYVNLEDASSINITLRGKGKGKVVLLNLDTNEEIGSKEVEVTSNWENYNININNHSNKLWLGIKFYGKINYDFLEFIIK